MYIVCQRYASSKEDAEEILQEGFIRVFTCLQQYKNEGAFEGWVRKIMVNCALQKIRSKPILYAIPHSNIEDVDFAMPENITSSIATKELLAMINNLSPNYRMVFNLYVFEGMKHKEIAEMLHIAEGTSKSNLSDARKILQKMVAKSVRIATPNINYL
jgi:RNA polymerase sigma-70 factor, ECF subfamily